MTVLLKVVSYGSQSAPQLGSLAPYAPIGAYPGCFERSSNWPTASEFEHCDKADAEQLPRRESSCRFQVTEGVALGLSNTKSAPGNAAPFVPDHRKSPEAPSPPLPAITTQTMPITSIEADIIFNRASVALAKSQRLIASWLPPPTASELAAAKSAEQVERDEQEMFTPVPEL